MKPIIASSYVSDTDNPIKTPWGLTSNSNTVEYKMIDLNSLERIQDQIDSLNNQLIFDEDKSKRIKQAIKDLNNPLLEDAYSVDELVEYKKWYNQAAKNKLQISQTCKDWFEGIFALLIPFGVDYYKTKYRDTSLYNIKPVQFSIDILKEIAGFVDYFDLDVNTIIYNNLLIRINQKEMTKLKEVNTYTLQELKWYKFWYDDGLGVYKPSLNSKFKEALDEESKTEIVFDLDDLKLIKSCADNYYEYHVRDDYKMSIEEDNILDKLDARISFLRKKIIHQHTKDVFNQSIKTHATQEEKQEEMNTNSHDEKEIVANPFVEKQEEIWARDHIHIYTISDIYWISKWCEDKIKITKSIADKYRDASREIFKITGKKPEVTSSLPIVNVYVFFSLKELKEIRNYASMYYSSNEKTIEAKNTLYDINLRIKYLEKQSEEILNAVRKGYYETQNVMLETNSYHEEDIFWYTEWVLDKVYDKTISNIILSCSKALKEVDAASRFPDRVICYIDLKDLKEIRYYAMIHYNDMDHDFPDKKRLDEEMIALCRLDEKIAFMEEYRDARIKFQMEKEEKQNNSTETETNCKPATKLDCKSENSNAFIICECRGIATGMCDVELRLSNVIRECIEHGYGVEYKYNDNCITKGYIQSGEMIHNLKNDSISFKMKFVDTMNDGEFDIYSKVLDLKAIRFDDKTNTLYLQENA